MVENQQNSLLGKIAAYTEILASDSRSTIFVSLSESYRKMGMLDDAFCVAAKGLELLPDYGPGHVVLARIQCQQSDFVGSEKSFQKALQLDSNNLAALVGFSRLYLLQDVTEEARKLLLRARDLAPADSVINKLLLSIPVVEDPVELQILFNSTEHETESPHFPVPDELVSSEPFQSVTLADLYLNQGFTGKSLALFKSLLARDPDNLELRRRIRDIEFPVSSPSAPHDELSLEPTGVEPSALSIDSASTFGTRASAPDDEINNTAIELPVLVQLNRLLDSIQKRRGDV